MGLTFFMTTVLGSSGTGAFFVASQGARREFAHEKLPGPKVWSEGHEELIKSHERTLAEANAALEANTRMRYGEVKSIFDRQDEKAKALHYAIFEQDYAASTVRDAGMLIATEFHLRGLLSDSALMTFLKRFLTTSEGEALTNAKYAERQYPLPVRKSARPPRAAE